MKLPRLSEGENGWTFWIQPTPEYKLGCCDCGLIHDLEFSTDGEGRTIFRARRNNRSTAQMRRHHTPPLRCGCRDVEMGSYANQVALVTPDGKRVGIDACIAGEVQSLWDLGIRTVASCCGHNAAPPVISVAPESAEEMERIGYTPLTQWPHTYAPKFRRAAAPEGDADLTKPVPLETLSAMRDGWNAALAAVPEGGAEQSHTLDRTSPKGEAFIGRCRYCGKEGLTIAEGMDEACPSAPGFDTALLESL